MAQGIGATRPDTAKDAPQASFLGRAGSKGLPGQAPHLVPTSLKWLPSGKDEPYSQMTAEERLRFALWLQAAEKQNTKVLKDLLVESGPIRYRDGNHSEYVADFVPAEKKFYPYHDAVAILNEWFKAHSDDHGLRHKLTISGLSSALKAEKRAELAKNMTRIADVRVDTELRIMRGVNRREERAARESKS